MELKPDNRRVLMSEALKGQVPGLEEDEDPFQHVAGRAVYAVIDRRIGNQQLPFGGMLRSVLFGLEPEVEVLVELPEALATVKAESMQIVGVELHHGEETTIPIPGPFIVKAARIDNIDVVQQSCALSLQLQRVKKA